MLSFVLAVLVALAVLSFVLPYLGGHPGRLEPVP